MSVISLHRQRKIVNGIALTLSMLGAGLVNLAKTWLTSAAPEIWLFILGGLFILTTLIFPRGIAGIFRQLGWTRPGAAAPPLAVEEPAGAKEKA